MSRLNAAKSKIPEVLNPQTVRGRVSSFVHHPSLQSIDNMFKTGAQEALEVDRIANPFFWRFSMVNTFISSVKHQVVRTHNFSPSNMQHNTVVSAKHIKFVLGLGAIFYNLNYSSVVFIEHASNVNDFKD
jgi:hypothetical protein